MSNRRPDGPPDRELTFCAVCQVSIAAVEFDRGQACRTTKGRAFCPTCARSTPEERARRRRELEEEFADDAPVPVPAAARTAPSAERRDNGASPNAVTQAASPNAVTQGASPHAVLQTTSPIRATPGPAAPPTNGRARPLESLPHDDPAVLAHRVGELERAAFRLGARLTAVEERLDEILRRLK